MAPLIAIDRVSKRFRIPSEQRRTVREHLFGLLRRRSFETLTVLDHVSVELREGEALGIMGRNGSGKSTLLKIIAGVYVPDAGAVAVRSPITPLLELGIGWNFQLDAVDNILLIGTLMGLSLREAKAAVDEVLAFAELERFAHLTLKCYSSGMAARLAYAIAFRAVRGVLVLDEIFAVGDIGFRERCFTRYQELRAAGHSTILVSHDPAIIERFCTRVVLLEGGRVIRDGAPADVAQGYRDLLSRAPGHAAAAS